MADPTIDESRDGARVVVYGDSAPVTEQEWHCARLMHGRYELPVIVEPDDSVWYAGHAHSAVSVWRPTRAEAVAECASRLRAEIIDAIGDAIVADDSDETARLCALLAGGAL